MSTFVGYLWSITLELDNYKKITLPVSMKSGENLTYDGGETASLFSKNWQKIKEVKLDQSALEISEGVHTINFDGSFSQEGTSALAKLEVRYYGPAQILKK